MKMIIIAIILTSCKWLSSYYVEQKVGKNIFEPLGPVYLKTNVYHNGEIIKSWYDNVMYADSSLKYLRLRQADSVILKCKMFEK